MPLLFSYSKLAFGFLNVFLLVARPEVTELWRSLPRREGKLARVLAPINPFRLVLNDAHQNRRLMDAVWKVLKDPFMKEPFAVHTLAKPDFTKKIDGGVF